MGKMILKTLGWSAVVVLAVVASVALWLVLPGRPSGARTMQFDGFIELPGGKALNVLDYLTLEGSQLFVTSESSGGVFRMAVPPGAAPAQVPVSVMKGEPATHGVALLPGGTKAFVSRSEANSIDVFDPQTLTIRKTIGVQEDADAILYDPDTNLIYVGHGDTHVATLIDADKEEVVGTIPLGDKAEYPVLNPAAHLLYQNLEGTSQVAAIDLHQRKIVGQWPLTGCERPSGLAIDDTQTVLFIACSGNASMAVFDLATHRVVTVLPVGGGPDSVAFDPVLRRVYTAGKSGVLTSIQQLDQHRYAVVDTVHCHYGAHTLALDPPTHRIFVGYASLFAAPRIAVFTARP